MPASPVRLSRFFQAAPLLALLAFGTAHCAEGATLVDDLQPGGGARTPVTPDASTGRDAGPRANDAGGGSRDAAAAIDASEEEEPEDAGIDAAPSVQSACPTGTVQVGEYATWQGKVNIRRETGGAWTTDEDCTSGANIDTVAYCQKFWPSVTEQVALAEPTSEIKQFHSAGCTQPVQHRGFDQFACCAPSP